jgi:N utilization substance protein A
MEVPEIKDGTVEIRAVAREPGARSKIAVMSNEEKVDAVGACVGMKGSRVQTVVRELGGERIDVVLWSEEPITFVTRALSPAKVVHADIDPKDSKVTVVVADDQLSLAIGKGGQNARLAAKLTSFKIDLINESQYAERLEFQKLARVPIVEVAGIGQKMCEKLVQAGYNTADDVTRASIEDLTLLEGVGEKTAQKILTAAKARIEEIREEFMAERAAKAAAAEAEAAAAREAAEAEAAAAEAAEAEAAEAAEVADGEGGDLGDTADLETADETETDDVIPDEGAIREVDTADGDVETESGDDVVEAGEPDEGDEPEKINEESQL